MQRETIIIDGCFVMVYKLTDKEKEILDHVVKCNYIQFRSRSMIDVGNWEDDTFQFKLGECDDLVRYGFLEYDADAWHTTYVLSDLGVKYFETLDIAKE